MITTILEELTSFYLPTLGPLLLLFLFFLILAYRKKK